MAKKKKSKVNLKCDVHNTDYVTKKEDKELDSTFNDGTIMVCRFYNYDTSDYEYTITRYSNVKIKVYDSLFFEF